MEQNESKSFIEQIIEDDLKSGKHGGEVKTRFPPEPNGYLHIGHAKAICVDFGYAEKYNGTCNLRFDDTNPVKEDTEYVEAIKEDINWLGFKWDNMYFASDYFDKMYDFACQLIKQGKAFVCDLSLEESKEYKGDYNTDGRPSPYRDRSVEENLELFERMKNGEFADGEKTLKAKIDYNHPNMIMRDPVIYRIQHKEHHNTGNKWCIYPMYDFAHPIEDAIEEITHSICTLEFESNREIYDWYLEQLKENFRRLPHQYEFARLNITNTLMSKRYLRALVEENKVDGWDDPRMPTLSGLRRRGVRPSAIRNFVNAAGVSKSNSEIDKANFEHFIREDLMNDLEAVMVVLDPLKVTIINYPENKTEILSGELNSKNKELGKREIIFGREIFIEREDFSENPPKDYKRLVMGEEVRLRHAYFIKCEEVVKDNKGNIVELKCTYDVETKSGSGFKGRKPRGTIHWVHARDNKIIQVNNYSDLMNNVDGSLEFNNDSLKVFDNAVAESYIEMKPEKRYQFIRHGFYAYDAKKHEKPTFNSIVSLKG